MDTHPKKRLWQMKLKLMAVLAGSQMWMVLRCSPWLAIVGLKDFQSHPAKAGWPFDEIMSKKSSLG